MRKLISTLALTELLLSAPAQAQDYVRIGGQEFQKVEIKGNSRTFQATGTLNQLEFALERLKTFKPKNKEPKVYQRISVYDIYNNNKKVGIYIRTVMDRIEAEISTDVKYHTNGSQQGPKLPEGYTAIQRQ